MKTTTPLRPIRHVAVALALALLVAFTVSGCGSKPTHNAENFSCPSERTKSFPKTKFVANIGLAAGSFHHWIYKPWQEGKFKKGADGRTVALVKAGAAGLLDAKLLSNAVSDVKADPTLCNAIGMPLAKLSDQVSTLKSDIVHGDFSKFALINGGIGGLIGMMKSKGDSVTESYDN